MSDMKSEKASSSPPCNFSWVVPNEICACACPKSEDNVRYLRNEDVGVLVSLSEDRLPDRSARRVMECHVIGVEEFQDPTMEQVAEFISICEKAREESKIVCVHCRMGWGRTGTMLACYLVKFYGQEPTQSISNVRLMRPGSIETLQQERAVENFRDYLN